MILGASNCVGLRLLLIGCLLLWAGLSVADTGGDLHPLAPPDRSSPRATLESFIGQMNAAYTAYVHHEDAEAVSLAFGRAIDCLDLSQVAPTLHLDVGGYSALLLKEVLDRLELPPSDQIPGPEAGIVRWILPGTEIAIVRVDEGDLAGQYLFSGHTVESAREYFDRVRSLPYHPDATAGLLDIYLDNPGGLVPIDWSRALPEWLKQHFRTMARALRRSVGSMSLREDRKRCQSEWSKRNCLSIDDEEMRR